MRRAWSLLLLLTACETREVPVFDITAGKAQVGGGGANAGGGAGGGGMPSGVSGGGGAAGTDSISGGAGSGGTSSDVYGGGGSYESGGSAGEPLRACMTNEDCDPSFPVCNRRGCDATFGQCVPFLPFCSDELKPVCGCDGVTYWNDCVRVNSDAIFSAPGQCSTNLCPCDVGQDCEVPGASCSHLLPAGQMCGHGPGSCWMLPSTPGTDKKLWRECRPPDQGGLGGCVSTYEAIISEHSHVEARRDDPCN